MKIKNEAIEKQLKIKAFATNNTPTYVELNYLLVSIKKGEMEIFPIINKVENSLLIREKQNLYLKSM
ncbi:hypothetical protein [Chryseobacterium indoltheticum]|uniref:hypothetical protein n=1 Tax=Chryseobacterium indoltheticum TaxID=254 RepID=UPI003F499A37